MKSTYEKRWGHPRFKKAIKHLVVKARKREEAEMRQSRWNRLSLEEKIEAEHLRPGFARKVLIRLYRIQLGEL